jgi:hypothetical protein
MGAMLAAACNELCTLERDPARAGGGGGFMVLLLLLADDAAAVVVLEDDLVPLLLDFACEELLVPAEEA